MSNNVTKTLEKPKIGMLVSINPQSDQTRKLIVQGQISEILTKTESHPHGIMVKLETGEIGRVKSIDDKNNTVISAGSNESSSTNLKSYIVNGEDHNVEFKSGALWSSKLSNEDIKEFRPQSKELNLYGKSTSKVIISKTIASFLNTDGGTLIIGVKENKNNSEDEVIGIELEFTHLKDPCEDGYRRMLIDVIKNYFSSDIFNHLNQYIKITFEEINEKLVCGISTTKSDQKVFLKLKNTDHFFIRTDASTRELHGEEIVDYCIKRFNK